MPAIVGAWSGALGALGLDGLLSVAGVGWALELGGQQGGSRSEAHGEPVVALEFGGDAQRPTSYATLNHVPHD